MAQASYLQGHASCSFQLPAPYSLALHFLTSKTPTQKPGKEQNRESRELTPTHAYEEGMEVDRGGPKQICTQREASSPPPLLNSVANDVTRTGTYPGA